MSLRTLTTIRRHAFLEELVKVPAFIRRDLGISWSYRGAFFADWINMVIQVLVFYFLNRLVPADRLPSFGGRHTSYIEFVAVAIALMSFMQVSLGHMAGALRQEQLTGTLESLFVTPTAPTTLQLGSVVYDLVYVPVRTALFLTMVSLFLGVHLTLSGLGPTVGILLVFIPFVWGLGLVSAAGVLTFRRGGGVVGIGATILTLGSGAYFPVEYFPGWLSGLVRLNPITRALDATRGALLGDAGWSSVWPTIAGLAPAALISLGLGITALRLALRRERARGTLGMY